MIPLEKTAQVWCVCGNLGGGKTLTAVSMAYEALLNGYYVVSNVTLNISLFEKSIPWASKLYQHIVVSNDEYDDNGNLVSHQDFNPFTIPSGSPRGQKGGKRVLVILDECAEWFDQYQNARSPMMRRVKSWLRHSSKRSQDVVFIVQRRAYLHKEFRILVSRWITVDDLATFRLPVLKCHVPFMSDFVFAHVYDKSDTRISGTILISKSRIGQYYSTSECLSTFGGVSSEYELPKNTPRFPLFLLILWFSTSFYLAFCLANNLSLVK